MAQLAYPVRFASILTCLMAATTGSLAQDATVIVANAEEIVAALDLPDTKLAQDLFSELDEGDLRRLAFFNTPSEPTASDYALLLVQLGAPEVITEMNIQGKRFTLKPVLDFQKFVEAIDYGVVLKESSRTRTVSVEIDLKELKADRLRARGAAKGEQDRVERFFDRRDTPRPSKSSEPIDPNDRLGANFEAGDSVEIAIAGKPCYGEVLAVKLGRFDKMVVQLEVNDLGQLASRVRKRSLQTRLKAANQLVFWAPANRLIKLAAPPTSTIAERTWVDKTGKFKVAATYDGFEDGRVVLKRSNGKRSKVPLNKLSTADQDYVEKLQESGGLTVKVAAGGTLRTDWSNLQTIRPRSSREWKWQPPNIAPQAIAETSTTTLDVGVPNQTGTFGEDLEQLYVARDGRSAVAMISSGRINEKRRHLQRLDFATGRAAPLVDCPAQSLVLDVLPESGLVLMQTGGFHTSTSDRLKLYLRRLDDGQLKPICDFDAQSKEAFHKGIAGARLLAGNRVLSFGTFGNWIIWDAMNAKALYRIDVSTGVNASLEIGPQGRFLFLDADNAIFVIDTETGTNVASIPHNLSSVKRLSVDRQLKRLAIASGDTIVTVDLTNGEMIHAFSGGLIRDGEVDFVGEHLLVDDRYLVAPKYPLILWQYVMAGRGSYDTHATIRGGRLWYAARQQSGVKKSWSIASVPSPHPAISRTLNDLGDLDDLVVLTPGDKVVVTADTDLNAATEARVLEAVTKAFKTAGYLVVDEGTADASTKEALVICKRASKPVKVMIANPNAKRPDNDPTAFKPPRGFAIPRMTPGFMGPIGADWMYEPRTITPYQSSIAIRQGDQLLWTDIAEVREGQQFSPTANGSVQSVIERLTTPNIERLTSIELPVQICKGGPVGGAYGASFLDADGIVEDYFGE